MNYKFDNRYYTGTRPILKSREKSKLTLLEHNITVSFCYNTKKNG
jgi:hypothetical protein